MQITDQSFFYKLVKGKDYIKDPSSFKAPAIDLIIEVLCLAVVCVGCLSSLFILPFFSSIPSNAQHLIAWAVWIVASSPFWMSALLGLIYLFTPKRFWKLTIIKTQKVEFVDILQ